MRIAKSDAILFPFLLVIVALCAIVTCTGCASTQCDPKIIYQPVEVEVPVTEHVVLELPPEPVFEMCDQETIKESLRCAGRNIEALKRYSEELKAVIEANNNQ